MVRASALFLLLPLLLPAPGLAQVPEGSRADSPPMCGDLGNWQDLRRSFQSPDGLRWQARYDIPPLSVTDPEGPLRDEGVCRELVEYVTEEVGYPLPDSRIYGAYRYGDYDVVATVAVDYNEQGEPTLWRLHTWRLFVFRAEGGDYVTQVDLPEWPPR